MFSAAVFAELRWVDAEIFAETGVEKAVALKSAVIADLRNGFLRISELIFRHREPFLDQLLRERHSKKLIEDGVGVADGEIEVVCQILNFNVRGIIFVEKIIDVVGVAVAILHLLIFIDLFQLPLPRTQRLDHDQRAERAASVDAVDGVVPRLLV